MCFLPHEDKEDKQQENAKEKTGPARAQGGASRLNATIIIQAMDRLAAWQPLFPEIPEVPEIPEIPEVPEIPEIPEVPEIPAEYITHKIAGN